MALVTADGAGWIFERYGLPVATVADFYLDYAVNRNNMASKDETAARLGVIGMQAMGLSMMVNLGLLCYHIHVNKELYRFVMFESRSGYIIKVALVIWSLLALTNLEAMIMFLALWQTLAKVGVLDLPGAIRIRIERAEMNIKRLTIFSQLAENAPELTIQLLAVIFKIKSGETVAGVNYASIASTFCMLFVKMLSNVLAMALGRDTSQNLTKAVLEKIDDEDETDGFRKKSVICQTCSHLRHLGSWMVWLASAIACLLSVSVLAEAAFDARIGVSPCCAASRVHREPQPGMSMLAWRIHDLLFHNYGDCQKTGTVLYSFSIADYHWQIFPTDMCTHKGPVNKQGSSIAMLLIYTIGALWICTVAHYAVVASVLRRGHIFDYTWHLPTQPHSAICLLLFSMLSPGLLTAVHEELGSVLMSSWGMFLFAIPMIRCVLCLLCIGVFPSTSMPLGTTLRAVAIHLADTMNATLSGTWLARFTAPGHVVHRAAESLAGSRMRYAACQAESWVFLLLCVQLLSLIPRWKRKAGQDDPSYMLMGSDIECGVKEAGLVRMLTEGDLKQREDKEQHGAVLEAEDVLAKCKSKDVVDEPTIDKVLAQCKDYFGSNDELIVQELEDLKVQREEVRAAFASKKPWTSSDLEEVEEAICSCQKVGLGCEDVQRQKTELQRLREQRLEDLQRQEKELQGLREQRLRDEEKREEQRLKEEEERKKRKGWFSRWL